MENQSFMQNSDFGFKDESTNMNEQPPMPNNYMPFAIVGIVLGICGNLFCCINLIIGIISFVFSTRVKSKYNMRDFTGAQQASKNAIILAIISIVMGVIGLVINIVALSIHGMSYYTNYYENILNGNYY